MRVLQIAIGVTYSSVYRNLFSAFKKKGVKFDVYIPQHKNADEIKNEKFPFNFHSTEIIKPYDKFLYYTKIKRMTKDVEANFDLSKFSMIHSHSLFNDGAVAYEIYKKYKIPYIVAIRDTDVNQYFRKAIHLKRKALRILRNAENVIFISKAYKENVISKYIPNQYRKEIEEKSRIISNGISNFWLKNKYKKDENALSEKIHIIFVGQIIKRKNIHRIAEASNIFEKKYNKSIDLTVIGEKKDVKYFNEITKEKQFKYIPYINKEKLLDYYRQADIFVMPSITETFGLVYAEAMSQGLPVIYTAGQGFDGQFEDGEVGFKVDPFNPLDIAEKIKLALDKKSELNKRCYESVDKFNWDSILIQYLNLYKKFI